MANCEYKHECENAHGENTYLRTDSLPATAKFILGHFEWKACKGVSVHTSMARHLPKPDFQITSSGEEERPKDPRATHV